MTNTAKEIANLMMNNGKSASEMTHALSDLGGGSMQNGFAHIWEFFTEEAANELSRGRIQGGIVGALVAAAVGSTIYAVSKKKEKKAAHEAQGQTILNAMKSDASININPIVKETKENEQTTASNNELRTDFKNAMDNYESFMNEWVEFMKKYFDSDGTDSGLIKDYGTMMVKYEESINAFEEWEDEDMNDAEREYYIEVQIRVKQKLSEIQ